MIPVGGDTYRSGSFQQLKCLPARQLRLASSFRVQLVTRKGQEMAKSTNRTVCMHVTRAGVVAGLMSIAFGIITPVLAASDNTAPKWKVWTYNPSNRAFKGSVPAAAGPSAIATFAFPASPDVALLVTDHGSYKDTILGDLTAKTISAKVSDSGG